MGKLLLLAHTVFMLAPFAASVMPDLDESDLAPVRDSSYVTSHFPPGALNYYVYMYIGTLPSECVYRQYSHAYCFVNGANNC